MKLTNHANFRDFAGFSSSITIALKDLESPPIKSFRKQLVHMETGFQKPLGIDNLKVVCPVKIKVSQK